MVDPPPPPAAADLVDPSVAPPAPAGSSSTRVHHLDALRAAAMLLGIVLHAAIEFLPYYRAGDAGNTVLEGLFLVIHGFRMPLFFLLSGFFTAMVWRRRGTRGLLGQRLRRIGLPLLAGVVTILPALIVAGLLGWVIASQFDGPAVEEFVSAADGDGDGADDGGGFSFAHLWFLWMLLWLVAGFVAVVEVGRAVARTGGGRQQRPSRPAPSAVPAMRAVALVSLPLLSVLPQLAMREPIFGPDTSDGLLPAPHVLAFYATFFAFGAVAFPPPRANTSVRADTLTTIGRRWPLWLALSAASTPLGLPMSAVEDPSRPTVVGSAVLQVAFAWLASAGLLGLFAARLSRPRFAARYLSDASYWMYLVHLPIVLFFQGVVVWIPVPTMVRFALIVVVTTVVLLLSYHWLVRYTGVGWLLNGWRRREDDRQLRASMGQW
ncbi:MAG: acyltransferase family protein [Actinomycetota bacterium]